MLGDVVEADDAYTGEHCRGVVALCLEVGAAMALDAAGLRNLEFGALLHDVGKVAVPNEIINKPGPLDDEEWAMMRAHTIEGQRMLERIGGFMNEVGAIVARLARALGRRRLPRRPGGRGDPARGAHRQRSATPTTR